MSWRKPFNTMKDPVKLKYLFEAQYHDGSIYKQNPQDASVKFPPTIDENGHPQGRSCMADIQEDLNNSRIRRFSLVSDNHRVSVDLGSGLFEVDGLPVLLESEKLPCLPDKFTLVFYHQTTQSQNVVVDKSTGKVLKRENLPEFREYFIGWRCEIRSKNYQQKIAVT